MLEDQHLGRARRLVKRGVLEGRAILKFERLGGVLTRHRVREQKLRPQSGRAECARRRSSWNLSLKGRKGRRCRRVSSWLPLVFWCLVRGQMNEGTERVPTRNEHRIG